MEWQATLEKALDQACRKIADLSEQQDILLVALKNLLEACYRADEEGELYETIDGSLLDAAKDAIARAEKGSV